MSHTRRTVVGVAGAAVVSTAGCLRASIGDENSNGEPTMELRNELTEAVTAEVTVVPTDATDPVVDDRYDLDAGGTRTVTVAKRGSFRVSTSMVDGPVESIFEHQWNADADPTLTVTVHDSGVSYE